MLWSQDHKPSSEFLAPGDRFIPTRSLMDIEHARSLLTPMKQERKPKNLTISPSREEYRRRIEENLTMDAEGKPFKMLVFRGSPRNSKKNRTEFEEEENDSPGVRRRIRKLPKTAEWILDGPELADDYYLNLIDWGKNNILAVALGPSVYLWNAASRKVQHLLTSDDWEEHPTSVAWSSDGKTLAVGFANSRIEMWDAVTMRRVRTIDRHLARVGSLSWNGNILTSGSRDTYILNHDVRVLNRPASYYKGHREEVCGLRWTESGNRLASGGNDNFVHVWESSNTSKYLYRFSDHSAAVRALAWCPFQSNLLASGGGTSDRCIRIWNTNLGKCINSIDTGAQVCALEWNRHQKEILSAQGYTQNQLSLWAYPSLSKISDFTGHTNRVLHLSQSPDGLTVVSAATDETLRFWKIFEPPSSSLRRSEESDSPLSLTKMHIR